MKERIAVTIGDPGGIGPEVTVRAVCSPDVIEICAPVIVGCAECVIEAVETSGLSVNVVSMGDISESDPSQGKIEVLDLWQKSRFPRGTASAEAGSAVVNYVKKAVELVLEGASKAMVTAPVSKESLGLAGFPWRGHTGLLAHLTGADEFAMMFVSDPLKVILGTIHIPLAQVPSVITEELLLRTIRLAHRGLEMIGIKNGRIAVAGLNPHAGESGLLGDEEKRVIIPALRKALDKGYAVSGPYPPDIVFHKALNGAFDIVLSLYHDQGLIPFKMIAFERGVNMTVGLPVIRTSPCHGTGFDIAWKNSANPSSMIEAVKLAVKIASRKQRVTKAQRYRAKETQKGKTSKA
jgi:4-hydroxythreonine-4-phosphate dehydrogenase